jgi:hypothetical protein
MANWLRRCFGCGFVLASRQRICPRCGLRQRPSFGANRIAASARFHVHV